MKKLVLIGSLGVLALGLQASAFAQGENSLVAANTAMPAQQAQTQNQAPAAHKKHMKKHKHSHHKNKQNPTFVGTVMPASQTANSAPAS